MGVLGEKMQGGEGIHYKTRIGRSTSPAGNDCLDSYFGLSCVICLFRYYLPGAQNAQVGSKICGSTIFSIPPLLRISNGIALIYSCRLTRQYNNLLLQWHIMLMWFLRTKQFLIFPEIIWKYQRNLYFTYMYMQMCLRRDAALVKKKHLVTLTKIAEQLRLPVNISVQWNQII